MREGKMEVLEKGEPTLFSLGSFMRLQFPSCTHYFHFMTHSDNLLCLKLHLNSFCNTQVKYTYYVYGWKFFLIRSSSWYGCCICVLVAMVTRKGLNQGLRKQRSYAIKYPKCVCVLLKICFSNMDLKNLRPIALKLMFHFQQAGYCLKRIFSK